MELHLLSEETGELLEIIELDDDVEAMVLTMAEETGRTPEDIIKSALLRAVDDAKGNLPE